MQLFWIKFFWFCPFFSKTSMNLFNNFLCKSAFPDLFDIKHLLEYDRKIFHDLLFVYSVQCMYWETVFVLWPYLYQLVYFFHQFFTSFFSVILYYIFLQSFQDSNSTQWPVWVVLMFPLQRVCSARLAFFCNIYCHGLYVVLYLSIFCHPSITVFSVKSCPTISIVPASNELINAFISKLLGQYSNQVTIFFKIYNNTNIFLCISSF